MKQVIRYDGRIYEVYVAGGRETVIRRHKTRRVTIDPNSELGEEVRSIAYYDRIAESFTAMDPDFSPYSGV